MRPAESNKGDGKLGAFVILGEVEELGMRNLKKAKLPTGLMKYQNSAGHSPWQSFLADTALRKGLG